MCKLQDDYKFDSRVRMVGERALATALGQAAFVTRGDREKSSAAHAMLRLLTLGSFTDRMSAIFAFREAATESDSSKQRLAYRAADALLASGGVPFPTAQSEFDFPLLTSWALRLLEADEGAARPCALPVVTAAARVLSRIGGPGGQDGATVRRVRKRLLLRARYSTRQWALNRLWLANVLTMSTTTCCPGTWTTDACLAAAGLLIEAMPAAILLNGAQGRGRRGPLAQHIIDRRNALWFTREFNDIENDTSCDSERARADLLHAAQSTIQALNVLSPWAARERAQFAVLLVLRADACNAAARVALMRRIMAVATDTSNLQLEFHETLFCL